MTKWGDTVSPRSDFNPAASAVGTLPGPATGDALLILGGLALPFTDLTGTSTVADRAVAGTLTPRTGVVPKLPGPVAYLTVATT